MNFKSVLGTNHAKEPIEEVPTMENEVPDNWLDKLLDDSNDPKDDDDYGEPI